MANPLGSPTAGPSIGPGINPFIHQAKVGEPAWDVYKAVGLSGPAPGQSIADYNSSLSPSEQSAFSAMYFKMNPQSQVLPGPNNTWIDGTGKVLGPRTPDPAVQEADPLTVQNSLATKLGLPEQPFFTGADYSGGTLSSPPVTTPGGGGGATYLGPPLTSGGSSTTPVGTTTVPVGTTSVPVGTTSVPVGGGTTVGGGTVVGGGTGTTGTSVPYLGPPVTAPPTDVVAAATATRPPVFTSPPVSQPASSRYDYASRLAQRRAAISGRKSIEGATPPTNKASERFNTQIRSQRSGFSGNRRFHPFAAGGS